MTDAELDGFLIDYVKEGVQGVKLDDAEPLQAMSDFDRIRLKKLQRKAGFFSKRTIRVAATALAVIGLVSVGGVTVKALSINPWKQITSTYKDSDGRIMADRTFEKRNINRELKDEAVSDVPTYIPEGLKERSKIIEPENIFLSWTGNKDSGIDVLGYSRDLIESGMSIGYDPSYDEREELEIDGKKVVYETDNEYCGIDWMDEKYFYVISIARNDVEKDFKDELKKMMQSLYQE